MAVLNSQPTLPVGVHRWLPPFLIYKADGTLLVAAVMGRPVQKKNWATVDLLSKAQAAKYKIQNTMLAY